MSDRVQNRTQRDASETRPLTKPEKRALAKAAKAKAAAAKKRREAILGALAGLAVVGVIVATFFLITNGGDDDTDNLASTPGATTSAGAPAAPPDSAVFPPLPDGADPALGSKPQVTAGTGELTELTVTPLIEGTGPPALASQNITVNYVGVFYETGEEFDASWKIQRPFSFQLGAGGVIKGWDQGLVNVKIGSRVQLDIPAALAYPDGGGPAGPLRFVVDVLGAQ